MEGEFIKSYDKIPSIAAKNKKMLNDVLIFDI